jgi:hypothetical protein
MKKQSRHRVAEIEAVMVSRRLRYAPISSTPSKRKMAAIVALLCRKEQISAMQRDATAAASEPHKRFAIAIPV